MSLSTTAKRGKKKAKPAAASSAASKKASPATSSGGSSSLRIDGDDITGDLVDGEDGSTLDLFCVDANASPSSVGLGFSGSECRPLGGERCPGSCCPPAKDAPRNKTGAMLSTSNDSINPLSLADDTDWEECPVAGGKAAASSSSFTAAPVGVARASPKRPAEPYGVEDAGDDSKRRKLELHQDLSVLGAAYGIDPGEDVVTILRKLQKLVEDGSSSGETRTPTPRQGKVLAGKNAAGEDA